MKFFILCMVLVSTLSISCAKKADEASPGPCAKSIMLGAWKNTSTSVNETMTFNDTCKGTDNYCASTFSFPNATPTFGTAAITVLTTGSVAGCLPLGTTSCDYQVSGARLDINCGGGGMTFIKQ